jgi:hypothetical protein
MSRSRHVEAGIARLRRVKPYVRHRLAASYE